MAVPKKLALLVGCNYNNRENKLHGCINDVHAMQALISHRFGFRDENITILTDKPGTKKAPTSSNIKEELGKKVNATKPGDTLLFYFSGGGARVTSGDKNETISVIVPSDLKPITGKDILERLKQLPDGAFFTFICDSSYSGGLFDKNVQTESNVPDPGPKFHRKTIPSNILEPVNVRPLPSISHKHIILLGSSKANQESVEVYLNGDKSKAFSAYSGAIQAFFNSPKAVEPRASKTNSNVEEFIQPLLNILGFAQHPVHVYSPDNADNNAANKAFLGGYVA